MSDKKTTFSRLVALRAGLSDVATEVDYLNRGKLLEKELIERKENKKQKLSNIKRKFENLESAKQELKAKGDYSREKIRDLFFINDLDDLYDRLSSVKQELSDNIMNSPSFDDSVPKYEFQISNFPIDLFWVFVGIAVLGCMITGIATICGFDVFGNLLASIIAFPWIVKIAIIIFFSPICFIIAAVRSRKDYKEKSNSYKSRLESFKTQKKSNDTLTKTLENKCFDIEKEITEYRNSGKYEEDMLRQFNWDITKYNKEINVLHNELEKIEIALIKSKYLVLALKERIETAYSELTKEFMSLIHPSDYDKLDYILYLFDTNRCDTMKEALIQLDEQKRNDRLVSSISEAKTYIANRMAQSINLLDNSIRNALSSVAVTLDYRLRSVADSISSSVASNSYETQLLLDSKISRLENSLSRNLDKSCSELVRSIDSVSATTNVYIDSKKVY